MQDPGEVKAGQIGRLLGIIRRAAPASRQKLIEAIFCLLAARFALSCLPFNRLMLWCSRAITVPELTGPVRRSVCVEVRRAIHQVAPLLPVRTVCFPRAIAAQMMLRRRRIGTDLYYGAAMEPGQGLKTHVWLQDGDEGIIGHRAAAHYRVLARYSTSRSPCP